MLIIVPESYPNQVLTVTLSGVDCILALDYQERTGRWRLSLSLADGTPLVQGVKVTRGTDLLAPCKAVGRPLGKLAAIPRNARHRQAPTWGDWGVIYNLTWLDAGDLGASSG